MDQSSKTTAELIDIMVQGDAHLSLRDIQRRLKGEHQRVVTRAKVQYLLLTLGYAFQAQRGYWRNVKKDKQIAS